MDTFKELSKKFDEFKKIDRQISECDEHEKQKIISELQKPIKADFDAYGTCW